MGSDKILVHFRSKDMEMNSPKPAISISVAGYGLFVSARPMHGDQLPSPVQGIRNQGKRVPSLISSEGHLGQFSQAFCVVLLDGCSIDGRAQEQRGLNWIKLDVYLSFQKVFRSLYGLCSTSHSRQQDNHTSIAKTPKGVAEIQGSVLKDGGFCLSVFRRSGRWMVHCRHIVSNGQVMSSSLNGLALAADSVAEAVGLCLCFHAPAQHFWKPEIASPVFCASKCLHISCIHVWEPEMA
jgi:hypothetical protein